jgi:hypothetical protein
VVQEMLRILVGVGNWRALLPLCSDPRFDRLFHFCISIVLVLAPALSELICGNVSLALVIHHPRYLPDVGYGSHWPYELRCVNRVAVALSWLFAFGHGAAPSFLPEVKP